jgi:trans-aconitate 2-methyltransferase
VIDLGCGPGNSTSILQGLWPDAEITGLDSSPEMIQVARAAMPGNNWVVEDIAAWAAGNGGKFDVVFSNAALQWVDDHQTIYRELFDRVAPGGALAVQVPGNHDGPPHRLMREIAGSSGWRDSFRPGAVREWHVHYLDFYYDVLASRAARLDLWETVYMHVMEGARSIVEWYKGTGLRPFLEVLADDIARERFCAEYLEGLRRIYPRRPDGRVLFPFHRLFLVAYRV